MDGLDPAGAPSSSAAETLAIPLAKAAPSGPTSSTASPGSNLPSQRSTPIASRLAPSRATARRAPSSTCRRAATGLPKRSQSLNAECSCPAAKTVPRLAGDDRLEHGLSGAPGDDGVDSRRRGHLGGEDLAAHSALAGRGRVAQDGRVGRGALRDQLRSRRPGSLRVDAFDLRQEDQQPRLHEHRDLRGERVVVAEGDLVGRGRVVLVHDRDRAEAEQAESAFRALT